MKHSIKLSLIVSFVTLSACGPRPKAGLTPSAPDQIEISQTPDSDFSAFAEPSEFNRPWAHPDTSIVLDMYQSNVVDWGKMATDRKVAGIIHRASIGLKVDTLYKSRQITAERRGYLWGAYHLGRADSHPLDQAKLFLKTVGDATNVLLVLDLEDTSNPEMMSIANAKIFMNYVYQITGKVPVVYANHFVTQALNKALANDPVFKKSRLWYARFRADIPNFPRGIWNSYFLWQFTSEINCSVTGKCLYNVPGTKFDMDVNVYYGTKAALAEEWRR